MLSYAPFTKVLWRAVVVRRLKLTVFANVSG